MGLGGTSRILNLIKPDNKFQKKNFVSVMNMLLIYLFASMKLENGHKKELLGSSLKIMLLTYLLHGVESFLRS